MSQETGSGTPTLVSPIKARGRSGGVTAALATAASVALVVGSVAAMSASAETGFSQTTGRPFATNSVWNSPIPTSPGIDANSASMVTALSGGTNQQIANLYAYAAPIYYATASTPMVSISCKNSWGICGLPSQIRIPDGAHPDTGSDYSMVVIDTTTNTEYDLWQATNLGGGVWQTSYGDAVPDVITGSGVGHGATATKLPYLGGRILEREIAARNIPHALAFSTSQACSGTYRYPASKTDGQATGTSCVPEGTRVQLDPTINVAAIPGITPGELAIARALQTYGAYAVDRGGARMGFTFEGNPAQTSSNQISQVYKDAGFQWDYFAMSHIPWAKLRVLNSWDGGGGTPTSTTTAPTTTTAVAPVGPNPPTELVATATSLRSISLQWTASSGSPAPTQYVVWRGDANWSNWTKVGTVAVPTTTFVDRTVRMRRTYTYAIRAVDANGNVSANSNVIKVTAN